MKKLIHVLYVIVMLSVSSAQNDVTGGCIMHDESSVETLPFTTIYVKDTECGTTFD